tara:strand:- start:1761 stop:3197 length:1437 start_codon:yes stop_codon:yes gene_type:complete
MYLSLNVASPELLRFITKENASVNSSYSRTTVSRYSEADVQEMLSQLDPDMSYEEWLNIGMALHSEGYDVSIWDNWSANGTKYKPKECQKKWKSFNDDKGITMGTLIKMARDAGYAGQPYLPVQAQKALPFYHWSQLANLPRRKYLIKGLLELGSMSVIYGASNTGKTFVALDMACHIAYGWEWQNRKTRAGSVVYIAAEGGLGIQERLKAFQIHNNITEYASMFIIPTNVCLCGEQTDLDALLSSVQDIPDIKLIVIDTLARAMGGADENTAKDMGAFIKNCDFIREETKAHVMVIHHSGKDEGRGARGSNSLKCAIDTEIQVTQENGIISANIIKQRDGKTGDIFSFELQAYEVDIDEDGDSIFSCALKCSKVEAHKQRLSGQANQTYLALCNLIIEKGIDFIPKKGMTAQRVVRLDDFKDHFFKAGIANTDEPDNISRAFNRQKNKLKELGYIGEWDGDIWLLDRSDKAGQTKNP